ncbi:MAG: membrane protein insertion efficiency factor YidD [Nitrospirae bacterium]|nr:membrane protein insertion efficiency factor YidD [Nitrospirota bacterium]
MKNYTCKGSLYAILFPGISFFCLCIYICHPQVSNAGSRSNIEFLSLQYNHETFIKPSNESLIEYKETSEAKLFFLKIIHGYQTILSKQDKPSCNFNPSCSRFGKRAIEQFGVIQGILMTSDRLQRCNGYRRYYPIDIKTGLAIDPIEKYALW